MSVREETDGSLLPMVNAALRAMAFLTVPWSVPERAARSAFRAAAEHLAAEWSSLGIACFSLDEDTEWCQAWLASLGVPPLGDGNPLGAGSMLWLEAGRVVSHEIGGCRLQLGDIIDRARSLWANLAEPSAGEGGGGI